MVVEILMKQSCIYTCFRVLFLLTTVRFNVSLNLSIFVDRITRYKYIILSILVFLGNLLLYQLQKRSENIKEDTKKKGNKDKCYRGTIREDFFSEFLFLCSLSRIIHSFKC